MGNCAWDCWVRCSFLVARDCSFSSDGSIGSAIKKKRLYIYHGKLFFSNRWFMCVLVIISFDFYLLSMGICTKFVPLAFFDFMDMEDFFY